MERCQKTGKGWQETVQKKLRDHFDKLLNIDGCTIEADIQPEQVPLDIN